MVLSLTSIQTGRSVESKSYSPFPATRKTLNLLTLARDLRRRKSRERHSLFVAEGVRAVEEAVHSTLEVRGVLVADRAASDPRGERLLAELRQRGIPIQKVSDSELVSAADTETPQGILAIGVIPVRKIDEIPTADRLRLLVLDAVQDPGNVGTILRTAAALGVTATIAMPGTVDLWSAKVVRSAMGAHFRHFCLPGTWDDVDAVRRERGAVTWGADAAGEPLDTAETPERLVLVVGNEGSGLSSQARSRADRLVALPIAAAVDSLNVAVATGIFLYELRR
jgi:RNA methyltransferase, TrmH family